jgi:hypothetical protein
VSFEVRTGRAGAFAPRWALTEQVTTLLEDESAPVRFPCAGASGELQGDRPVVARVDPARRGVPLGPRGSQGIAESAGFFAPHVSRPGGGIGRRGRLKIGRPQGRVGSSPTPGIASIASGAFGASFADSASQAACRRNPRATKALPDTPSRCSRAILARAASIGSSSSLPGCVSGSGVRHARLTRAGALSNKPGADARLFAGKHAPAPNETKGF